MIKKKKMKANLNMMTLEQSQLWKNHVINCWIGTMLCVALSLVKRIWKC